MSRYQDVRFSPSLLIDGACSVIVCAINYKNRHSLSQGSSQDPKIASYALNRDYHKTIRKRLKRLLKALQERYPGLEGRCFVDSAPLLEKQLAVDAGLGWIGRQSLLITPEHGSFVLLGEIVIDRSVDIYDTPYQGKGCGACRLCTERCPAQAITSERMIDARRCISCRTVEVDNNSDITLAGWVFGCDECQICCPHNSSTPLQDDPDFMPIIEPISTSEWSELSQEQFAEEFGATPLKRAGLERIKSSL